MRYVAHLHDGELWTLLLRTVETVVDVVAAHGVVVGAHGHDVETLARFEPHRPVIVGHAGDDVVVGELPACADAAVLHPDVGVLLSEGDVRDGVLNEDAGVGLAVVVHDAALVGNDVLQPHHR